MSNNKQLGCLQGCLHEADNSQIGDFSNDQTNFSFQYLLFRLSYRIQSYRIPSYRNPILSHPIVSYPIVSNLVKRACAANVTRIFFPKHHPAVQSKTPLARSTICEKFK